MTETIQSKKSLPLDGTPPVGDPKAKNPLLEENTRIQKVAKNVFCLLASALLLGLAAAICFTIAPVCSTLLLVGSVALATLGIVIGLNRIAHRFPKCIEKTIHLVHAAVTEIFALVAVGLLYPLQGIFKEKITPTAIDERPILLIHGYFHNSSGWIHMMNQLQEAGFKSIYAVSLWHPLRSIDEYVEIVQDKAREIAAETERSDLILVGHSMGGLVASKAALTADKSINITDVFTLGSPLKGTPLARLGLGTNARQMQTDSEFINDLGALILKNEKNIRFFEVASEMDAIVPKKYALLDQAKKQLVLDDIGHIGMLFSTRISDWIIDCLRVSATASEP